MGKGEIVTEYGAGLYGVTIRYGYRARVNARIQTMQDQITLLNQRISEADEGLEKQIMELQVVSLERQIDYLERFMPNDVTRYLWCADLSEGLTGEVGLIEIPDEIAEKITTLDSANYSTTPKYRKILIRPGFEDDAVYSEPRDGEIVPVVAMSAAQMFWNKAALPGVQKWMPRFRYGTIVADSIDFDSDTCSVCLDPEYSSQQNLVVNQGNTFSECEGEIPQGFTDFCTDNPTHPTCINTQEGGGVHLSESDYELVRSTNESVNQDHEYQTDQSGYGIGEHWTEMAPGDRGDCEDYALTKQKALNDAGIPIQHLQLAVGETETGGWHAFLMIRSANRGTIILDNRYDNVMSLANVPYRFHSYQGAGSSWNGYGVRLEGVPIEYMNCNAGAFADGDQVIVEFTSRDYNQPKVIGFRSQPQGCLSGAFLFWQAFASPYDVVYGYNYQYFSDSYSKSSEGSLPPTHYASCGSPDQGLTVHYLAGDIDTVAPDPGDWYEIVDWNYQYTVATDAWVAKTNMDDVRSRFSTFSFQGYLIVVGGWNDSIVMEACEKYVSTTDLWSLVASSPVNLFIGGEFVLSGLGYSFGGASSSSWSSTRNSNNCYDPESDAWTSRSSMPAQIAYMAAFEDFYQNKGYITGGGVIGQWGSGKLIDDYGVYLTERCYEYDPETNAWTRKTDHPTWGCEGAYYPDAGPLPPGWYIDPDNCQQRAGYGVFSVPGCGGYDIGMVCQDSEETGATDHVMPTCQYTPSTDVWVSGSLSPEKFRPYWAFSSGFGCSI